MTSFLSDRLIEALTYAAKLHNGQPRKGSSIPYVSHLLGVAGIVMNNDGDEDEAIAALLHDGPEDQGGLPTLQEIRTKFGQRVAGIVEGCSDSLEEDPSEKAPWAERKAAYLAHLSAINDRSVYLISAADKLDNARLTLQQHQQIGDVVWKRFDASKKDSLRNYHNLIEAYDRGPKDERRVPIVRELRAIIAALDAPAAGTQSP